MIEVRSAGRLALGNVSVIDPHLASAFAHELRAPLAALATSSGILVEDLERLDRRTLRGVASSILRRTLWLQEIVENLLTAAIIGEDRFRIVRRAITPRDAVDDAVQIIGPLLESRHQPLRISVSARLPIIDVDRHRIGQVLVNLLSNASKFSEQGRAIDISVKQHADRIRFTVSDRGPGLDVAELSHLFEPFYRGSARRLGDGIGLGLAVVSAIVSAHEGAVGAENRRGGGARFWFELPGTTTRETGAGNNGISGGRTQ